MNWSDILISVGSGVISVGNIFVPVVGEFRLIEILKLYE